MPLLMNEDFKIDVVLVIDATASMGPMIEQIKAHAATLGDEIIENLQKSEKPIESLRIRVVDFADFATEGSDAIHASKFFSMPDEKKLLEECINKIGYEERGGDIPENALEALWTAINSDWVEIKRGERGRHIIVLITDAPPLYLGERDGCEGYVADDYPKNIWEMEEVWHARRGSEAQTKLNERAKRLLLVAPEEQDAACHRWESIANWDDTMHIATDSAGLTDLTLEDILSYFPYLMRAR